MTSKAAVFSLTRLCGRPANRFIVCWILVRRVVHDGCLLVFGDQQARLHHRWADGNPAHWMSGFGIRRASVGIYIILNIVYATEAGRSNPKPGHTTGGSGQGGARQGGGAGRGGAGRDAEGSVRPGDDRPSCLPGHRGQLS